MDPVRLVEVTSEPLDSKRVLDAVRDQAAGAIVLFEGTTRDVPVLRYEVYEPMALARLRVHASAAVTKFNLSAVALAHRTGDVPLTETSVSIAASSPHRPEAFAAARWLIDAIKADVPIWKQEIDESGDATWGVSEQDMSMEPRNV